MKEFDFQAWRTAKAEKYSERMWPDNVFDNDERKEIQRSISRTDLLAGMATEAPVAELRGEIAALKKVKKMFFTGSSGCRAISVDIIEAEDKLARLLEKGDL